MKTNLKNALDQHAGLRAINAILGDEMLLASAIDSVGGIHDLQDLIADLATKSDEWDVMIVLKDARCAWLEGSF